MGPKTKSRKALDEPAGAARAVLVATDVLYYTVEGDAVLGEAERSVFTHYLIQGLRSGAADSDQDGQIGLGELYDYICDQAVRHAAHQKPRRWTYRERDRIIIARNPNEVERERVIKWDLIAGAILAPITSVAIGWEADWRTAVGMGGLLLLLYGLLYWVLE